MSSFLSFLFITLHFVVICPHYHQYCTAYSTPDTRTHKHCCVGHLCVVGHLRGFDTHWALISTLGSCAFEVLIWGTFPSSSQHGHTSTVSLWSGQARANKHTCTKIQKQTPPVTGAARKTPVAPLEACQSPSCCLFSFCYH